MNRYETKWTVIFLLPFLIGAFILGSLGVCAARVVASDNLSGFEDTWELREYVAHSPSYFSGYHIRKHNCAFIAGDLYLPAQTDNVPILILWDAERNHWANIGIVEPNEVWYIEPYTAHIKFRMELPEWIMERWQTQGDFMGVLWRHGEDWNIYSVFIETPRGFKEIDKYGNIKPALGWPEYKFEWRTTPNWWQ